MFQSRRRRTYWLTVLVVSLSQLLCAERLVAGIGYVRQGPGNVYLVAVGIGTFQHATFGDLESPEQEARRMYSALSNPVTGLVVPSSSVLLVGSVATHDAIISSIRRFHDLLKEDDVLIIYWSGRSFLSKSDGAVYMFPYDVEFEDSNSGVRQFSRKLPLQR